MKGGLLRMAGGDWAHSKPSPSLDRAVPTTPLTLTLTLKAMRGQGRQAGGECHGAQLPLALLSLGPGLHLCPLLLQQ